MTDILRASHEGHWFHEAWTARKAMQLLLPTDELIGIAVEGLSEEDQSRASRETVGIADLTVYYGQDANFRDASRVETLQFKYSPKRANKPFRASDAKKTVEKFSESYRNYKKNYGAAKVTKKLFFELITNRPIFSPLQQAIKGIAEGKWLTGDAKAQARQFEKATGLAGQELVEFASKCRISDLAGTRHSTEVDLWKILVDWSATADAQAGARLGAMRAMVKEKAGYEARYQKVITQVDVLDALGLSDVAELLPCPESLASVEQIVEREQLADVALLFPALTKPLIIHANGGIGKTVFLQSLASLLLQQHEVIFFDCFGGGAYRSPEDGRHLPHRGLVHIANVLACRGLCDPILPGSENVEMLFSRFRKRLAQCVRTLAVASPGRKLVLFIDAIDNAAEYADERGDRAFPVLLLESIQRSGSILGVTVIASGRTHRIRQHISDTLYHDFELHAFTIAETTSYLSTRMPDVTEAEINVAQSRSEGNARILEHLVTSDRGLLDPSEIDNPIVLADLLNERIEVALKEARKQGYKDEEVKAFLAGLAVLPPPVPLDEYAGAHDMDVGAIQSFSVDLVPLLDRTREGMIFRDEPTETLVRERYGTDTKALKRVAENLLTRQAESVYAARALPGLLQRLDEGKKLFNLAFDERFPSTITSTVGQRRIRYARLEAAVMYAAGVGDNNSLVRLLVELSTISASDERGTDYILDSPDLVVNAQDVDALRRLFETRTSWAGSRHARLTIASVLSGDLGDASRYFINAFKWMRHYFESIGDNEHGRARPEHIDYVAIPFFRLAEGEHSEAIRFMRAFYPQYAFEISKIFFGLSRQAILHDQKFRQLLDAFLDGLTNEIGLLAGGLSFWRLSDQKQRKLLKRLGKACKRTTNLKIAEKYPSEESCKFSDGLRKAATIAVSFGMVEEALSISFRAPHLRPRLWSMADPHSDPYSDRDVFPYLFRVALRAVVKGTEVYERDILPCELVPLTKRLRKSLTGDEFKKQLKDKIQAQMEKERDLEESERQIREETRNQTNRFLNYRLTPLLKLTRVLASFLGAPLGQADRPFQKIIRVWAEARTNREGYYYEAQFNYFFHWYGVRMVIFALWARSDLKAASIKFLLKHLHQQNYLSPSTLIEVIEIIATRPRFDIIVGKQAVRAQSLIEREDDVTTRSDLFAKLARAILPVSTRDATEYFKVGLEQLDAIGSGDYKFASELLHFASSIEGKELSEEDVHTFTNICELNMSYESERFPWSTFATAMSKISGPRGLAKLSRWHDRSKVNLEYTLLPYLTALVRDRKITPEDALALNRLAAPAELWICNTEAFATAIFEKQFPNAKTLFTELIRQYEENNPRMSVGSSVKSLATIAGEVFGKRHATTKYLLNTHRRLAGSVDGPNEQQNHHPSKSVPLGQLPDDTQQEMRQLRELASMTTPLDEDSLRSAVSQLKDMMVSRELEREFFRRLRTKVRFADRSVYIGLVARLEELDIYAKLKELAKCKDTWATSSASLDTLYQTLATPLLDIHVDDFLDSDGLSTYQLKEISDLTRVSISTLTLELVKILSTSDWDVPSSAWLGLATIICGDADEGQGQKALEALLNSSSARLTSTVVDGPWERGLYPADNLDAITSGLVWQLLGSPRASDRWCAAHSVRRFAQLGRWEVVEALVRKLPATDSKAFGAPELPFYYLHARLWLLIALARIALDFPTEIAKHHELLMKMALNRSHPHVVIRHFAAQAVLVCDEAGALSLSEKKREELQTVNNSPFPDRGDGKTHYGYADFYAATPDDASDLDEKFYFDYDFDKYEVYGLASVFAQQGWVVRDLITDKIRRLNPSVTSMYDEAGRETPPRRGGGALTSGFHVYGQYLAWHALRFVAGRLLSRCPITENENHSREWSDWLSYKLLTRSDGLWLSDGMDRPPLRTRVDVLEKDEEGLALTGDRDKLMSLIGIDNRTVGRNIVVDGDWRSPDGINVHISSALVHGRKGKKLAKTLLEENDAFSMWLPVLEYDDEEYGKFRTEKLEYRPWIVKPPAENKKLDEYDPLGVISIERRPRFSAEIADYYSLGSGDPFQRSWHMPGKKLVATTNAWGFQMPYRDDGEVGAQLVCRTKFLSNVLNREKSDLILLIKLSRYEQGDGHGWRGKFSNTVAVLRIRKDLKFEYFAGPVNQVQLPRN